MLNDTQRVILHRLQECLQYATNCELLDELAVYVHPDTINGFCDAVLELIHDDAHQEKTTKTPQP